VGENGAIETEAKLRFLLHPDHLVSNQGNALSWGLTDIEMTN